MYINILEREKEMPKFQIASDLHIEYKNESNIQDLVWQQLV